MTHHTWTPKDAQDAVEHITTRAAQDEDFRKLCLTSPGDAVREATGHELPEGFVLRFVDNAQADLTVVLPDLEVNGEIVDAALSTVAGGLTRQERQEERRIWGEAHRTELNADYERAMKTWSAS